MANQFVNIPVPLDNAAGDPVDVSRMGLTKTLIMGGTFEAYINVQYATDELGTNWASIASFQQPGNKTVQCAARWMRAVTTNYLRGTANLDVGGNNQGAMFAQIPTPPLNGGTGAPVSIADFPAFKNVVTSSPNESNRTAATNVLNIEFSLDGTTWSQVMTFQTAGGKSLVQYAQFARATWEGKGSGPTIYIGGAADSSDSPGSQPFTDEVIEIFANQDGSDETGNGTEENPFRTYQHASLFVPEPVPPGVSYDINITNLGTEVLPDGYCTPPWKTSYGMTYDADAPYYNMRAGVNIVADPQIASNIPEADATIAPADLVPTLVGNGIADVSGFNDVTADGVGGAITVLGDDIAMLAAGADPEASATWITIAGDGTPANNGTFPVVEIDGDGNILYENAAAVESLGYAGAWEAFTPFVLVETTDPHGLWNSGFAVQEVTIAGVLGSIAAVTNGSHVVTWRTVDSFIFEADEDATSLVYGGAGTVSVLFVQDPVSGQVQIKTNKAWPVDELVGKLFVGGAITDLMNASIYRNTADTLYLTTCFPPGAFGTTYDDLLVMEQSAEFLTTCTTDVLGSRRGPGRGGFTVAECDSLAINGVKITPIVEGEIGLLQMSGTLAVQGCNLATPRFQSAAMAVMSTYSYMSFALFRGSKVDLDRCHLVNRDDNYLNGAVGWLYAYFGTVFENWGLEFDTTVEQDLFAVKCIGQGGTFFTGKNTWNRVSGEDIDGEFLKVSGPAARNRMEVVEATLLDPANAQVLAFNGGALFVTGDSGPFARGSFTAPGDFMALDGMPVRTFEDWRQHALIELAPVTANFDTVFEAINPFTSTVVTYFGDPPYPLIEVVGDSPPAGGVTVDYDPVTGVTTIHYEDGVSTVLDAETEVDNFSFPDGGGIRVKTAGTPGNVLASPGDDVPETRLDPGVNGPCGVYTGIVYVDDTFGPLGTQSTVIAYTLT